MITLSYPHDTPTDTLQLPNPELGNGESIETGLVLHTMISGKAYTYIKPAQNHRHVLQFVLLTDIQITNLIAFINTAGGNIIKYTDYNNENWSMKIVSGPTQQTVVRDNQNGFVLELEGTKDD